MIAGKVFVVKEDIGLAEIGSRLRDFRIGKKVEVGGKEFSLVTAVRNLEFKDSELHGVFSRDKVVELSHRGEKIPVATTSEAPFFFSRLEDKLLLAVLEKKNVANAVANRLSKLLFMRLGGIVEARINPERFRRFHEENLEDTKVVFFDDVDIPGVKKLSLYGSALADTRLYLDYLKHGNLWYIVLKPKNYDAAIGVTRHCVVTIFGKAGEKELTEYMKKEIFPLI
jgi:hypothetical protein